MRTEQEQPEETQSTETEPEQQEQEQPETEEKPAEEGEPKEAAPEGEAPAETPEQAQAKAEEKHRRAGGWQRKIERLERERQLLMEQNARLAAQHQPPANVDDKPKDPAAELQEYIRAEARRVLEAEREQERQARVKAEFERRTAEVRVANPDFDDVLMSASDLPVSQAVQQALLTSEHGPALMYQLAKNPAELARISALPPLDAAREIGRLEAKASSTPAPTQPVKSATRPPAPPTSVGGSASSTRSLDDLPISEYKRAYRSGRR